MKENLWLSKANLISFLIHTGIVALGSLITVLPSIQEYMVTDLHMDSSIAWAATIIIWVLLKKIVDKK